MNQENALTIPVYDGLEIESQTSLVNAFSPFFATADKWRTQALTIKVTDVSQKREMKLAQESRLALKEVRVAVEKKRKSLKADILLKGKAIDGCANIFNAAVEPIENYLLEQETFAERIESARIQAEQAALRDKRNTELNFLGFPHDGLDLGVISESAYLNLLADAKAAKAENDRVIAEAKAKEEERQRLAVENARLKAEAQERERLAEIERQKVAAEAKAKEEEAARALAQERAKAKAEADRIAAEEKVKAEAVAAQLRSERRAREIAEAEIQAAKKAEEYRVARELEAQRLAALAPEREKLMAFAAQIRSLPVPDVTAKESIQHHVEQLAKWVLALIP